MKALVLPIFPDKIPTDADEAPDLVATMPFNALIYLYLREEHLRHHSPALEESKPSVTHNGRPFVGLQCPA